MAAEWLSTDPINLWMDGWIFHPTMGTTCLFVPEGSGQHVLFRSVTR